MISAMDYNVGRLLDRLRELGLDQDSLVVFMSDNGVTHGEHQMLLKGPAFYEELVRTPLIIRWPGRISAGTRVDSLASSLDLFPTVCAAAGIDPPAGLHGRSLWPLLCGEETSLREALFFEYHWMEVDSRAYPMRGLVTQRHKYVKYLADDEEELYDLQLDPGEMRNLIGEQEYRETADSLREKLALWVADTADRDSQQPAVIP
jgi:arylsulfatase A-like enzyme